MLEHTAVRHSAAGISIVESAPPVSRNHIHHHGTGSAALMLEHSRSLVRDNLIAHNTTRQALFVYACDSRLVRNTLQGNIIGLVLHANDILRCPDGATPATVELNQVLRNTATPPSGSSAGTRTSASTRFAATSGMRAPSGWAREPP
ncbi:right-handed parallel beta-helix repeat-containing protein [Myxococcus landrumensis]|uniref:Right-handed parallel beta-helix repeat-containing protein n=1 Tax=Myxococcus landrumensis TaxID=2813577 RepID=A0ABX7N052_9BACT|nr:right-handed parallel beta-helix repeat-containing protein [Myxococcus landrumus]